MQHEDEYLFYIQCLTKSKHKITLIKLYRAIFYFCYTILTVIDISKLQKNINIELIFINFILNVKTKKKT